MKGKESVIVEMGPIEAEKVVVEIKILAERTNEDAFIRDFPVLHSLRVTLLDTLGCPDPKP